MRAVPYCTLYSVHCSMYIIIFGGFSYTAIKWYTNKKKPTKTKVRQPSLGLFTIISCANLNVDYFHGNYIACECWTICYVYCTQLCSLWYNKNTFKFNKKTEIERYCRHFCWPEQRKRRRQRQFRVLSQSSIRFHLFSFILIAKKTNQTNKQNTYTHEIGEINDLIAKHVYYAKTCMQNTMEVISDGVYLSLSLFFFVFISLSMLI